MPIRFDPYHKWLGIPPAEQPPHHYRLLGVQPFESDPDVISNASDQRMSLLKTLGTSTHNTQAEELLNEIARARVCLLNTHKKQAYDRVLHDKLSLANPGAQAPQGFWLPPLEGPTDVLDVACPHCDEEMGYDTPPSAQVIACQSCGKPMWVPGQEEVARAMAHLAPKPASTGRRSFAQPPHKFSNAARAINEHAVHGDQPVLETARITPVIETHVSTYRRKRSRRSPFALILLLLGAIIGLLAGYFVLCVIDLRYDFLHLISTQDSTPNHDVIEKDSVEVPREVPPATTPKPLERSPKPNPRVHRDPEVDAEPADPVGLEAFQPESVLADPLAALPLQMPLPVPPQPHQPTIVAELPAKRFDDFELSFKDSENRWEHLSMRTLNRGAWVVRWSGAEIARFSTTDGGLQFEWVAIPSAPAVTALRNSILKISADGREHFTTLRAPATLSPLTIDLNKSVCRAVCAGDDYPDLDELQVDILELVNCPRYSVQGEELVGLKVGDERTWRYADANSAFTTLQFTTTVKGLPAIELKTSYRLPSGAKDTLNIRRVNEELKSLGRSLKLRNSQAMRRDRDSLVQVKDLAPKLDGQVKVRFRVYCVLEGHEIELAVAQ